MTLSVFGRKSQCSVLKFNEAYKRDQKVDKSFMEEKLAKKHSASVAFKR